MANNTRRTAAERGFTLIEVVIAMVILAVGLMSLQALGIGAARSVAASERNTRAATAASEYLEDALRQLHEHAQYDAAAPPSLCLTTDQGDQISRTVDYTDPRLPRITVTVTPAAPSGPPRPVTVSSHAFFSIPVSGPGPNSAGAPCS